MRGRLAWGTRSSFAARRAALALSVTVVGCANMLGIDGEYVVNPVSSGSTGGESESGGATAADAAGTGGAGGVTSGTGGTSVRDAAFPDVPQSTGGVAATGGAPAGTGGLSGDGGSTGNEAGAEAGAPETCRAGHYSGTFTGEHAPVVAFVPLPFNMKGTFSFDLVGTGPFLSLSNGHFSAQLAWGTFHGTLIGNLDCTTELLSASMNGVIEAPVNVGEFTGQFTGDLTLYGDPATHLWSEHELVGSDASSGKGYGKGSWLLTNRP